MAATHHVVMMQMRFMTKPASIMSGQEKNSLIELVNHIPVGFFTGSW